MSRRRKSLMVLVASAFLIALAFFVGASVSPEIPDSFKTEWCERGWYVTGYFVPDERDYSGDPVAVRVANIDTGLETPLSLKKDFLTVVSREGWGLASDGKYVGGWDGKFWGPENLAYDSRGNELVVGTVAVDVSVIPHGKKIVIPTLPEPWNKVVFNASDVGNAGVRGKHVDVFTGSGRGAEDETFRITGDGNVVCVGSLG